LKPDEYDLIEMPNKHSSKDYAYVYYTEAYHIWYIPVLLGAAFLIRIIYSRLFVFICDLQKLKVALVKAIEVTLEKLNSNSKLNEILSKGRLALLGEQL
jgi:hypothetical protein